MPENPGSRPPRARRPSPRRTARPSSTPTSDPSKGGSSLRDRLRQDPFLFLLCLGGIAFATWAFALTWWVTGSVLLLGLALVSVAPAFFLFYLRDA